MIHCWKLIEKLALELLAHARDPESKNACLAVLRSSDSRVLRVQAARSLAGQTDEDLPGDLLAIYPEQTPTVAVPRFEKPSAGSRRPLGRC